MAIARDLLKSKDTDALFYISPDASALEALKMMSEHNIGAVLVEKSDGSLDGILSERDLIRKLDAQGRSAAATKVREIMTTKVLYVEATQSLDEVMAIMNDKNIRHLPVYDGKKLLGLISVRDVLREVVHEQKFIISQLEHYINGSR